MSGPARACPYRGLEPFDEADAAFFFGRERESRLIAASLYAAPLTLLYGASGVGKSSVLRAGLLPRLRERKDLLPVVFPRVGGRSADDGGSVIQRGWQSDPLGGVKETVALELFSSAGEDDALRMKYRDAVLNAEMAPLREFLDACHRVSRRRLMIVLDQFEEYSLYHPVDEDFGRQLPLAIVPGDLSVSFLISLREDGLAKLDRFKGRIPSLWDSYRRVDHLDRAAAGDAVRLPLREYNRQRPDEAPVEIEDELVETVLREVQTESVVFDEAGGGTLKGAGGGRIETPYLQLVMTRLWEREMQEGSTLLRWETLRSEGGSAEIVRTHLDRVMAQFTNEERDVAARIFHRLVTPSGAKIAFSASDLSEYEAVSPELLSSILARLEEGNRRILRRVASRGDQEEPRYEIFHDRLGKAILAWRVKRVAEQERERRQKEEIEQVRVAEQTRSHFRETLNAALGGLDGPDLILLSKLVPYLVSHDGRRFARTIQMVGDFTERDPAAVAGLLARLEKDGVLRMAFQPPAPVLPFELAYEVASDGMAVALLEWQTEFHSGSPSAATAQTSVLEGGQQKDFPYDALGPLFAKGRVIPFLGAGASMSARQEGSRRLPSGQQIKELLARACNFPPSEMDRSDIAEITSFFALQRSRRELNSFLHEQLRSDDLFPSAMHLYLAEQARSHPLLILTTNYDTLMEQALEQAGVVFDVIAYQPEPKSTAGKLLYLKHGETESRVHRAAQFTQHPGCTVVYRLNGPAFEHGRPRGIYAITEEDQIDWILSLQTTLPAFVEMELAEKPLLSLGHSARDWSQRALLRMLRGQTRSKQIAWAVALNPAPLSVMVWQRYAVEVFNLDLNEFAGRMRAFTPRADPA